jgi:quercetin dioxygenase-like cupin family protein
MADTTVTKVNSTYSPRGQQGQTYLASGKSIAMRLWRESPTGHDKTASKRDYETAGYVISGHAELEIEGQTVKLEPGDSWIVPKGAEHRYRILDEFTAVEATSPPAHVHGRDL